MHQRALAVLCLAGLLTACGSDKPQPQPPAVAPVAEQPARHPEPLGPLPAYQRELSGTLLGIPAGAEVELALLVIDTRGRPQQLLANEDLQGTGQDLPYRLRFNPDAFPAGARVELRGRASQSGQLILHMQSRAIAQAITQGTGPLRFEKAP